MVLRKVLSRCTAGRKMPKSTNISILSSCCFHEIPKTLFFFFLSIAQRSVTEDSILVCLGANTRPDANACGSIGPSHTGVPTKAPNGSNHRPLVKVMLNSNLNSCLTKPLKSCLKRLAHPRCEAVTQIFRKRGFTPDFWNA